MYSFEEYEILMFLRDFQKSRPVWYDMSACHDAPREHFFPNRGQSGLIEEGIKVCRGCPVRQKCFLYAMSNQDANGVWGGSSPSFRKQRINLKVTPKQAWKELMEHEESLKGD